MILEIYKNAFWTLGSAFLGILPYVMPFILVTIAWRLWRYYVVRDFISKIEWISLEVRLPKEHQKTPAAMEIVLGAFYQPQSTKIGDYSNWYDYWWTGKVAPWFSLEMVSIGGHIHFFIRTPKNFKSLIENHIYSQYPEAEVHLVPDYVGGVNYENKDSNWSLFGSEFVLAKEDAYPIKTYVDYGLDKEMVKEEQKVDPITSTIEFIGSVGKDEQVWIQILVTAAKKRFKKKGKWFETEDWKGNAKGLLDKLLKRGMPGVTPTNPAALTAGEKQAVEAIERNISKMGFDCGIRALYLAKKDKFSAGNIPSLMSSFKQYGTMNLNSFKPSNATSKDWWKDYWGRKVARMKIQIFRAYCHRGCFYPPFKQQPFTLNTEELATIFHFPGAVSVTPTFGRLESKRAEAPVNLPI